MSAYGERFWKRNWDEGMTDLDPSAFETTYVDMIKPIFEERPNKTALGYLGVDLTFGELDGYSNQFANMLLENGFRKGDIVGINLPNTPEYLIALIGTLKAGCVCTFVKSSATSVGKTMANGTITLTRLSPHNKGSRVQTITRVRAVPSHGMDTTMQQSRIAE